MITPKKTLYKWFSNFMKPAQEHFRALIDSFYHKNELIPMSSIEGLSLAIESTASAKQLLNHLDDTNAHRNLFDKKVDKEEGKGLSSNDFTNEHKQKLEELQPTDVSGLLPKGGYDGTGQQLKEAIDGLQTKMQQVETTLSVDDTALDTLQEIATQVKSNKNLEQLLTGKVDKEEGKGLSSNDFTNEYKQKLDDFLFLGDNLIEDDSYFLPSSSNRTTNCIVRIKEPQHEGYYLLSYIGKKIGEGTKIFLCDGDKSKSREIVPSLINYNKEKRICYYLIDANSSSDSFLWTLFLNFISEDFIKEVCIYRLGYNMPVWKNSPSVYTGRAYELKNNGYNDAVFGRVNTIEAGKAVSIGYIDNACLSIVRVGSNKGFVSIISDAEIIGDTEIRGEAGSSANVVCAKGKVYITVHNKGTLYVPNTQVS
jgi:hypothetical protein